MGNNKIKNKFGRHTLLQILMTLAVCLFCVCGQTQNESGKGIVIKGGAETKKEIGIETALQNKPEVKVKDEAEVQTEPGWEEKPETEEAEIDAVEADAVNPAIPDNDIIREAIYNYYEREFYEKISEEEVEAVKGKLRPYDCTIRSGEDLLLMREWYDWSDVEYLDFHVFFGADLSEWSEEELSALEILTGTVYVESKEDTFPAKALTYLTGTKKVLFSREGDFSDVTGDLPAGAQIPEQIKAVTLYDYRAGKYTTLLHTLEKSQVETITVYPDSGEEKLQGFWLDDVAKIPSLKELVLDDIPIRIREKASLTGCPLSRIEGYVDSDTDLGFVEKLAALEEVSCGVLEEMDLSPFLERKGLSLYLYFCRQLAELEEAGYEGESYVVCPEFYKAVDWQGEPGDEKFLAIYQRREDQGRVVECFTERYISYSEYSNMWSFAPWIRVTDGSKVYELKSEEEEGINEEFAYAGYRTDQLSLTDINFDGEKDIVLASGGYGAQMLTYDVGWIWNQSGGIYEYSPTYRWIANASADQKHRIVRSCWRNSAGSHSWAIYRYEDGEFVVQSELTEEFMFPDELPEELAAPEVVEVIRWQEEIYENGEVAEVKTSYGITKEGEEMVYPEVYESYFAEDSYWGG